jgi:hypothetical protein
LLVKQVTGVSQGLLPFRTFNIWLLQNCNFKLCKIVVYDFICSNHFMREKKTIPYYFSEIPVIEIPQGVRMIIDVIYTQTFTVLTISHTASCLLLILFIPHVNILHPVRASYTINTAFWLDNIGKQEQNLYLKVLQCMTMGEDALTGCLLSTSTNLLHKARFYEY